MDDCSVKYSSVLQFFFRQAFLFTQYWAVTGFNCHNQMNVSKFFFLFTWRYEKVSSLSRPIQLFHITCDVQEYIIYEELISILRQFSFSYLYLITFAYLFLNL